MKGTLTIIKADGETEERALHGPPELADLQKAVGGYIELVPGFHQLGGAPAAMFCNEEGKLHGLPFNLAATSLRGSQYASDPIVGDVVIVWGDRELIAAL